MIQIIFYLLLALGSTNISPDDTTTFGQLPGVSIDVNSDRPTGSDRPGNSGNRDIIITDETGG